jgi:hypothetical protein
LQRGSTAGDLRTSRTPSLLDAGVFPRAGDTTRPPDEKAAAMATPPPSTPPASTPPADPFAQILPTLSAGARGLRDLRSYAAAATVLAMTILPGVLVWALAFGLTARGFTGDPFGPGPGDPFGAGPNLGQMGLVFLLGVIVWLVAVFGFLWAWMAIGVRAVSLERGIPSTTWRSVTTGLRRALVALGGGLLILLMGVPLLILYAIAWVMADVVVLSGVSAVLTMVLVVAIFAWWIGLLIVGYLVGGFAAADEEAGVMTVLRRAFGLTISNPAAVVMLLMSVWLVTFALVFALYGPTFLAGFAGWALVGEMSMGGRNISAALAGVFITLFFVAAFVLVPVNFAASALASFAVRIEPDMARIEAAGRGARKRFRGGPAQPAPGSTWPSGPGQPPHGQPPSGAGPQASWQRPAQGPPPQGRPPQSQPPGSPPPSGPPSHGPPPSSQPPQGPPPRDPPPAGGPPPA